jgi:hypothetical protein
MTAGLSPPDIPDDRLLTLQDACDLLFGNQIKVATLRSEIDRGNLTVFRIGRRFFTTPQQIREMVQKCRVNGPLRGSSSIASDASGLSETERISAAQAALKATLEGLKGRSPSTSATSTVRPLLRRRRLPMSS